MAALNPHASMADVTMAGGPASNDPEVIESAPRGPTAEQAQAIMQMDESDQQAMIRGMVDGLAARMEETPNDIAGWERLIRAQLVLGDKEAARKSLTTAQNYFAGKPEIQLRLAPFATQLGE